jgi:hypothetical protein
MTIEQLEILDRLLGPRTPGGPGMDTIRMNYPNLAKLRRLIGSDDAEIAELKLSDDAKWSQRHNEGMERFRQEQREKARFHKAQGKLTPLAYNILCYVKAARLPISLRAILGPLDRRPTVEFIGEVEAALQNLYDRGLVSQSTNHINRKPGEPLVYQWQYQDAKTRRILTSRPRSTTTAKPKRAQ